MRASATVLRFVFALLFVLTSVGKLLDNRGFAAVLGTYQLFPSAILLPLALSISLGELLLGYSMLRGWSPARDAKICVGIYAAYTVLTFLTLWRGIELTNCGCFGVFLARPLTNWTAVEDMVLLSLATIWWLLCIRGETPSEKESA